MPELPWEKWYPSNWASEPGLKMCCSATRGIWFEALNTMMLWQTGKLSAPFEKMCSLLNCTDTELRLAVQELSEYGVSNVIQNEVLVFECRRMVRRFEISKIRSDAVSKRWKENDTKSYTKRIQASASASTSLVQRGTEKGKVPEDPGSSSKEGGLGEIGKFKAAVSKLFKRAENEPWKYEEERLLVEVFQRPGHKGEWNELKRFKSEGGDKFFPNSVRSLLEKWTETLDRSRLNSNPHKDAASALGYAP